jgi:ribosomal protein S18 acetylase RimI-like enzyme
VPLRELRPGDRGSIERILRATGMFTEEEVAVALELVDDGLGPAAGGYRFIVSEQDGEVAGYACFGLCPMTDRTWDLYWIAIDPPRHGRGHGVALVRGVEDAVRAEGARLLLVETAGKPEYAPTRAFYDRIGYPEGARIRDFYRDGDDKVIYVKRIDEAP